MFTGIVETTGKVEKMEKSGTNYTFTIESAISAELKIDQSVSHNGVCLTVVGQHASFKVNKVAFAQQPQRSLLHGFVD
ncbi:MAG: hypothetical protein RIE86_12240, partial [Imperialibacter sp.]